MMLQDHVKKRETSIGRWLPFSFHMVNFMLWFVTGIMVGAWDLLWLGVLALPSIVLYILRTGTIGHYRSNPFINT